MQPLQLRDLIRLQGPHHQLFCPQDQELRQLRQKRPPSQWASVIFPLVLQVSHFFISIAILSDLNCGTVLNSNSDDPDVNDSSGTRFGNVKFSRHEYNTLPGRHRQKSDLSIEFKTSEPDGIIFYAAENRHIDYTALYLKDGKVNFINNFFLSI